MALSSVELRIGNWVDYRGNYYQITSINDYGKSVKISRQLNLGGIESLDVPSETLKGIKFTEDIIYRIEGFIEREYQEKSNFYLISLKEDLKKPDPNELEKNLFIDWSICIKELEGSWWVNIEDSSVTFETMGEGEFYHLHDLQNIIASFIYQEIVWKNIK